MFYNLIHKIFRSVYVCFFGRKRKTAIQVQHSNQNISTNYSQISQQESFSQVYLPREEDREEVEKFRNYFEQFSNPELVNRYNKIERLYGVHQQVLCFIAMNQEFYARFNKTPFEVEENCLISLGGKITYSKSLNTFLQYQEN